MQRRDFAEYYRGIPFKLILIHSESRITASKGEIDREQLAYYKSALDGIKAQQTAKIIRFDKFQPTLVVITIDVIT